MQLLEALYKQFPATKCDNCGRCCNGISVYSLEYHYIIRDLMTRLKPKQLCRVFKRLFSISERMVEIGEENRIRCPFHDFEAKSCIVHPVRAFACRVFGMRKSDGTRDCENVRDLAGSKPSEYFDSNVLQVKVMEYSESHVVFPDKPAISLFPFDFWVFRFTLGIEKALEAYREIIIPSSTPLTEFWADFPDQEEIVW